MKHLLLFLSIIITSTNVVAMKSNTLISIGLMSGTSMDGIDAALIKTNGDDIIEEISSISIPYTSDIKHKLKDAEAKIRANPSINPEEITALSTSLHIEAVRALLKKSGYSAKDIDVIGYHGQTMYHNPEKKISIILGDGAAMAKELGITVVNDFRRNDIELGGRGAPFAPIYHLALAKRDNKIPVAVVNCGGIANITIIPDDNPAHMIAYDTGTGNGLVDRLVRARTGGKEHMDENGKYGIKGKVHEDILKLLYAKSTFKNGKNFFDTNGPKALDINDMQLIPALENLSIEDACRTLEAFTADSIVHNLNPIPQNWILAGGGWNNPIILSELKARLPGANVITADEAGWDGTALEAQIFAYMAVRSLKGLPLSFPNTTGVPKPTCGGVAHQ